MNTNKSPLIMASLVSGVVSIVMILAGYFIFSGEDAPRFWRSLLINYLFFTSAAGGMVVLPAIVIVSHGKWMGSLEKICWAGISFSIPSIVALILLWVGATYWAPWIGTEPHKIWQNNTFLFTRNLLSLLIFWTIAFVFLNFRYRKNNTIIAAWLVFVYAITFSLTGFDFIMALDIKWFSMLMGGYYFISGLYIAAAAWIFLSIIFEKSVEKKILHDIGNLAITFCMLTSYLMFSQLLPIWYENLPEETTFLIPRLNLAWKPISFLLLGMVYLSPVILLMNRKVKENAVYMGVISFMILVGMWIERWWLVSAVFEKHAILFGWTEIVPTIAFLGVSAIGILLSISSLSKYTISISPEI